MISLPRCKTCRHFRVAAQDRRRGDCHGAPPTADAEGFARWPAVYAMDFCAAHQPVPAGHQQAMMTASALPDDFQRLKEATFPELKMPKI